MAIDRCIDRASKDDVPGEQKQKTHTQTNGHLKHPEHSTKLRINSRREREREMGKKGDTTAHQLVQETCRGKRRGALKPVLGQERLQLLVHLRKQLSRPKRRARGSSRHRKIGSRVASGRATKTMQPTATVGNAVNRGTYNIRLHL